ncbi:MAG: CDP-alcohol phosphatidyltransferase family protein [Gemmatimonadaceae bacterium]|nr:CDP-alcohol phosphatidyltransferase family protein [Gemmatimonadaceae bacterium]
MERDSLATLPNVISLSRLFLAALFPVVHAHDLRLAILAAAGLTDFLDGWLARRRHQFSRVGALIDPFADRIFVFVAICTLLLEGQVTTLEYVVFLLRDIATAGAFVVAKSVASLRHATFKARFSGKLATVLQLLALPAIVIDVHWAAWAVGVVGVVSFVSIVDYSVALWNARERA